MLSCFSCHLRMNERRWIKSWQTNGKFMNIPFIHIIQHILSTKNKKWALILTERHIHTAKKNTLPKCKTFTTHILRRRKCGLFSCRCAMEWHNNNNNQIEAEKGTYSQFHSRQWKPKIIREVVCVNIYKGNGTWWNFN